MWVWSMSGLFSEWKCQMLPHSRTASVQPLLSHTCPCQAIWSTMTLLEFLSRVSCSTRLSHSLTFPITRSASQALVRLQSTCFSPRSWLIWTLATTWLTTREVVTSARPLRLTSLWSISTSSWTALTIKLDRRCALTSEWSSVVLRELTWQQTFSVTCSARVSPNTSVTIRRSRV